MKKPTGEEMAPTVASDGSPAVVMADPGRYNNSVNVPIGYRRGSGANGIPRSASDAGQRGSVAYAAEPFSFASPSPSPLFT